MAGYLQAIYDRMGEELVVDDSYFERDSRFYTLEQLLLQRSKGRLLDMGCGQGALLSRVKNYHEVCGLEYDARAREIARAKGLRVESIDLNEAGSLPFGEPFDFMICSEVCEHLLNPRNVFKLAREHLTRNGLFIVTVPNAAPLFVRLPLLFGKSVDWLHFPSPDTEKTGHIRFYTRESLSRLAQDEGFEAIHICGVSWRMNGQFWLPAFHWIARLSQSHNVPKTAMLIDCWFGKKFPTLSPGLLVVLRKL